MSISTLFSPNNFTLYGNISPGVSDLPVVGPLTITTEQSGMTFFLGQPTAANLAISIPTPVGNPGLNYKFIIKTTSDTTHTTVITCPSKTIVANVWGVAGAVVVTHVTAGSNIDTITVSATAANVIPGDWLYLLSDGSNYYCTAFSAGAAVAFAFSDV